MKLVHPVKQIYIWKINTSETEIKDLLKAWIAISIAFAIFMNRFPNLKAMGLSFYEIFIIASVTVGTGFLLHELGHKLVAQRYGCFAEFRSFDQMLILAIIMALFFPILFAAPGAVMINGPVGIRRNGKISAAGPIVNLALAAFFLIIFLITASGFLRTIAFWGFFINSLLALFNMIPIWNLDGAKVLRWDKKTYGIIVTIALMFMFIKSFISI